jgi:hypothetical protein
VRIAGPTDRRGGGLPATEEVAAALSAAVTALGHRPAVTVVGSGYRHEQGFVSLAGWAAKGAHLLRDELGLGPGDVLGVDAPPSWPLAAVALAAWWAGIALGPVAPGRPAVVHEGRPGPGGGVLRLGDAVDGGPLGADRDGGEAWTAAVTPYPDRAPAPGAAPDLVAVVDADGGTTTQRELLRAWRTDEGVLGLRRSGGGVDPRLLGALAARPLVTGRPTVVLADAGSVRAEDTLRAERIVRLL